MSEALKKSEEMRQAAIALLLDERGQLDDALAKLGYEGEIPNGGNKKPRTVKCSKCGADGHQARTCPGTATPSAEL
jgi:hypothetical protein